MQRLRPPSPTAAEQRIYFGEDPDPTNLINTVDESTTYQIVGFPGFGGWEDPLEYGKTYYWKVDTTDVDTSVYPGTVWSFSIVSLKATEPSPVDGMGLVDLNPTLTWTAGHGAALHYVHFDTDYDTVANAPNENGEPKIAD